MQAATLRRWGWVHKWSSLVCTLFILMLCLTGLPLIFSHEIDHLTGNEIEAPAMPEGTPRAPVDQVAAKAVEAYRGWSRCISSPKKTIRMSGTSNSIPASIPMKAGRR